MKKNKVYVLKVSNKDYDTYINKIFKINDLFKKNINNISIKINLCDYRSPNIGATTDKEFLISLIQCLRRKYPNVNINVIENDASSVDCTSIFKILGYNKLAEDYNFNLVNVANDEWVIKKINGIILNEIKVPRIIDDSDLFLNFPKLKVNNLTKATVSLKNIFGLYKEKRKFIYHHKIHEYIVDINLAIKPDITIVDGNICMEGNGPAFGSPKKCGITIVGIDPVAVDSFCSRYMGFHPYFVKYLRLAEKKDVGSMKYDLNLLDKDIKIKNKFNFNFFNYYALSLFRGRIGV